MSKIVFVLGAGFNQIIKQNFGIYNDFNKRDIERLGFNYGELKGKSFDLSPPMAKDFFRYALISQFSHGKSWQGITEKVLDYIEKSFNRPRIQLLSENGFDLELFFTFLESKINDAKNINDKGQLLYLEEVRRNLISAIGEIFFNLEWHTPYEGRDLLVKFGQIINYTNSDVITFNYDCLAETGIERASEKSYRKHLEEPPFNWSRYSAYGIKFTKMRMNCSMGYYGGTRGRNASKKFYANYHNEKTSKFIKLHGSYNWYRYSNLQYNQDSEINNLYVYKKVPEKFKNDIICFNGDWQFGMFPDWSSADKNVLEPIIIPPILFKEQEIRKSIFQELWNLAKKSLLECEQVIFIGYSFPETDFYTKKLFLEVFSENKNIEVTIVNPDQAIGKKFQELVNFEKSIKTYTNSEEFIKNYEIPNYSAQTLREERSKNMFCNFASISEKKFANF